MLVIATVEADALRLGGTPLPLVPTLATNIGNLPLFEDDKVLLVVTAITLTHGFSVPCESSRRYFL